MQHEPLNLYEVVRYGNEDDGPNGEDTCFLVRARSVEEAAEIIDQSFLWGSKSQRVANFAAVVYLLGIDGSGRSDARYLRGPYVHHAYRNGWRQWHRDECDQPWVESQS